MELITKFNELVGGIVWGPFGIALLFAAGLWMTVYSQGFQFVYFSHWLSCTIGAIFKDRNVTAHTEKSDMAISQFQSLCTALAATIGTGNIVGVSTAIIAGGPGAIFWMWIMALLGMMTNFSENVLGIYYRIRNERGEWSGGAMYYLANGLKSPLLAALFAIFCGIASFGIGNIAQVNSIAGNLQIAFGVPAQITGIVLVILSGLVILGGLKRVASVTEKLVPFMALIYMLGAMICVIMHISLVPAAFVAIIKGAFGLKAVGGGVLGYGLKMALTWGFKRGAFSNEAGLGSSVMVHSSSNVKEPVVQGMWGIFEVFADTIVVCTLTALVVLTSGYVDLSTGLMTKEMAANALVGQAFGTVFGSWGPRFIALAILMFAFSTVLGWSHYGAKSMEFLFGVKITLPYKILFVLMSYFSATMSLQLAWDLSDTFNGLMMIPNLIGVLLLSPKVVKITRNYVDRIIRGQDVKAMLSAYED